MEETTITTEQIPAAHGPGIVLTTEAQHYLNETAGWGKFLGIMGFILSGLILIFALFAGSFFGYVQRISPNPNPMASMGAFVGVIYALIAVLYFFPSMYVYKFATKAKKGLQYADQDEITASLSNLKSLYKFWGIVTIIYLGLMALFLIGIIIVAAFVSGRH